jgi:hypothetical protein
MENQSLINHPDSYRDLLRTEFPVFLNRYLLTFFTPNNL